MSLKWLSGKLETTIIENPNLKVVDIGANNSKYEGVLLIAIRKDDND